MIEILQGIPWWLLLLMIFGVWDLVGLVVMIPTGIMVYRDGGFGGPKVLFFRDAILCVLIWPLVLYLLAKEYVWDSLKRAYRNWRWRRSRSRS